MDQIKEALSGEFTNSHPPVMSVILRAVFLANGSVSMVVYLQCLLGLFGLRSFLLALFRMIQWRPVPGWYRELMVGVTIILLLVLTPVSFHLATLVKDTWLAILFIWIGWFVLADPSRKSQTEVRVAGLFLIMLLALLVRHNALALVVMFCPLLYLLAPRWKWAWPMALVVMTWFANLGMTRFLDVRESYPGHQILVLDLMGMAALNPDVLNDIPHTRQAIYPGADIQTGYRFSGQGYLHHIMNFNVAIWSNPPALRQEYLAAIHSHPRLWLTTKIKAFHRLIRPDDITQHFHSGIWAGGREHPEFSMNTGLRTSLQRYFHALHDVRIVRFLQSHVLWLTLGFALILVGLHQAWPLPQWLIALGPWTYAATFVLSTVNTDYRFLYPVTLVYQASLALCLVVVIADLAFPRPPSGSVTPLPQATSTFLRTHRLPRIIRTPPVLISLFLAVASFLWWPYMVSG